MFAVALYAIAGVGAIAVNCDTRLTSCELRERFVHTGAAAIIAEDRWAKTIDGALKNEKASSMINRGHLVVAIALWSPMTGKGSVASPLLPSASMVVSKRLTLVSAVYDTVNRVHDEGQQNIGVSRCSDAKQYTTAQLSSSHRFGWVPSERSQTLATRKFQMMFTSGTTGCPKGVTHTQFQVWTNASRAISTCGLYSQDVWLHAAPMFHAMNAFATYALVACEGSQVAVATEGSVLFSPSDTIRVIEAKGVTVTAFAATQLTCLLDYFQCAKINDTLHSAAHSGLSPLRSLRLVSCGGSVVSPEIIHSFLTLFPWATYFTDYGMTEAGGRICTSLLRPVERNLTCSITSAEMVRLVSCTGRMVGNTDVIVARFVTRASSEDVIDGALDSLSDREIAQPLTSVAHDGIELGEVLIRGPTVIDEYWNSTMNVGEGGSKETFSQLSTSSSFLPGGWFRTGDAAIVDCHGWLRVMDRVKDVIITGGENVFCPEVERTLSSHPKVDRVAAYGVPDDLLGEVVELAVTLKREYTSTPFRRGDIERELLVRCASMLAPFKVPRRVIFMNSMPTTSTGKVSKRMLRDAATVRDPLRKDTHQENVQARMHLSDDHNNPYDGSSALCSPLSLSWMPRSSQIENIVSARVREALAEVVPNTHISYLAEDTPLAHAGLHSSAAVELARYLSSSLADYVCGPLPSLLAFNYPTAGAIVDYIIREISDGNQRNFRTCRTSLDTSCSERHPSNTLESSLTAIIITCSGSFPGSEEMSTAFALSEVQTIVPRDRWDADTDIFPGWVKSSQRFYVLVDISLRTLAHVIRIF